MRGSLPEKITHQVAVCLPVKHETPVPDTATLADTNQHRYTQEVSHSASVRARIADKSTILCPYPDN